MPGKYRVKVELEVEVEAANEPIAAVIAADEVRRAWDGEEAEHEISLIDIRVQSKNIKPTGAHTPNPASN